MFNNVRDAYTDLLNSGTFQEDAAQRRLVEQMTALQDAVVNQRLASKGSALGWLFAQKQKPEKLRGLYVYGSVGRGKTALMDLFYETAHLKRKRRAHFHAFMADIHERIHDWRQKLKAGKVQGDDPIAPVADQVAAESRLLCFDEFQVEDIADAMILGRLFTRLYEKHVVVVATSNTEPDRLYEDGLSRALFLPFIDLIKDHMDVVSLDARTDYRLETIDSTETYITPLGPQTSARMEALWCAVAGAGGDPMDLPLKGRAIHVPVAREDCARFSFADLCEAPLAASDYLVIAKRFQTVMVEDVPVLPVSKQNEARRFVNLIDALYDNRNRLIMSAAAEPEELHPQGKTAKAFERTASRLREMRSEAYRSGNAGD